MKFDTWNTFKYKNYKLMFCQEDPRIQSFGSRLYNVILLYLWTFLDNAGYGITNGNYFIIIKPKV